MAILAAVCFWATIPALPQAQERAPLEFTPRDFTLALSWQPAFCQMRDRDAACEDLAPGQWASTHFALHGLWPNVDRNDDGRLNADDNYCLPAGERAKAMDMPWRSLPAPNLDNATRDRLAMVMPGSAGLLERHQWAKHGSCSGFDATRYFAAAIARTEDFADTELSRFVAAQAGQEVSRHALIDSFELDFGKGSGRALRLICARPNGTPILSEIRLALRPHRIEQPLTRGSLAIPAFPPMGTCPSRLRIQAAD